MNTNYKKILYEHRQGFSLHHTVGPEAGASTLDYLHCNIRNMLIWFIRGSGSIKVEGKHYDIQEGDIVLLSPHELYHCTVNSDSYHERIVLYVNESILDGFPFDTEGVFDAFTKRDKGNGNLIPAEAVQSVEADKTLTTLLKLFQAPTPTGKLLSVCKVIELLIQLKQVIMPSIQEPLTHASSLIDEILVYINQHYKEDIDVSGIAEVFNIHKSYLSHLFTQHVGMSLWNYVILRRLHAFNDLLRKGQSIEESSYMVGFQNYSNFFRLYKKHTGMTPMQFKKQLQSK
ncbi:MAG: helix-turn-helix domain-containing protein [Oscillospiraceae bacterium]|nr:helix-turn-helix domain-containing protein [Oscillospiraceae bacterium]